MHIRNAADGGFAFATPHSPVRADHQFKGVEMIRHILPLLLFACCCLLSPRENTAAENNAAENTAAEDAAEDNTSAKSSSLGKRIADFTLQDYRGKSHSLSDFRNSKVIVVAFLGTECPLAKLYGNRLGKLHRQYKSKGVAFLAINSNCIDSVSEIAAYADKHRIDFPVLKDLGNKVADAFGAERTPEVFVLDEHRVIRYRGRVDDQYGIGYIRDKVAKPYLKNAVDEVLAGRPVSVSRTKTEGCIIARVRKPKPDSKVTYVEHIAPILQKRCVECHRPGEIAPFSLTEYDAVYGWAEMIDEVVHNGRMPPWHADPKYGEFANDRSMTKRELDLIRQWVRNGAPQGNPRDARPPASHNTADNPAKERVEGWQLPRKPDQVVSMRDDPVTVPAQGLYNRQGDRRGIPYKYFMVDPGFKEDKWIKAAEVIPGNPAVVHHILVIVRPPDRKARKLGIGGGEFLAGYVPGLRARPAPEGTAKFVPAGSQFIFQMHYTPIGSEQKDLSKIGLIFADPKEVTQVMVTTRAANRGFEIPAGAENHTVKATTGSLPYDVRLSAMMPHMHLRGQSFSYEAWYPDGTKEMLLSVPNYDFNWQTRYILAKPKTLPAGTRIHCVAAYDNSKYNLNNPNPERSVRWGDQTWDEMMIGYFDILVPRDRFDTLRKALQKSPLPKRAEVIVKRLDDNGDGKLSKDEVTPKLRRFFDRLDQNKDGQLTVDELDRVLRFLRR